MPRRADPIAVVRNKTTVIDNIYNNKRAKAPETYKPNPNTMWLIKLRSLACAGFDDFDAATPSPKAGCMTKNGAETVIIPKMSAGVSVRCRSQSMPVNERKVAANMMPIM